MAFKKKTSDRPKGGEGVSAPLETLLNQARSDAGIAVHTDGDNFDYIVDIMTFCYHKEFLELPKYNFNLWIGQRVILKCFYMGTRGNENLTLTDEEMRWLHERQLDNVIYRLKAMRDGRNDNEPCNFTFNELHLALGRRASKTIMTSIIVAYEAYKLIKLGDPYKFYNIPEDEEIAIINVANSGPQSQRLFSQIKNRIRNCKFFKDRVDGDALTAEIRLLTDIDIRKKADPTTSISVKGSIVLVCGHSNPDTLRGYSAAAILFDELAFYDENPIVSGKAFYNALIPSVAKFTKKGDGRLVEISSTDYPKGIFYEIWENGQKKDVDYLKTLSFRLATWDINEDLPYDDPWLTTQRKRDPDAFDVEFGSMWRRSGLRRNYFAKDTVDNSIKPFLYIKTGSEPGIEYFIHVDPAATRDNYALAVVGRSKYANLRGEKRYRLHLASHRIWKPGMQPMDFAAIDQQVYDICRSFRTMRISYDMWNSVHSIAFLRNKQILASRLSFSRGAKASYYKNLEDLMNADEFWMYHDDYIYGEFLNLKAKSTSRGVSIDKDPKSDFPTDDLCDCIAGAAWMASGYHVANSLPASILVNVGRIF
jgi:hypothetical protein